VAHPVLPNTSVVDGLQATGRVSIERFIINKLNVCLLQSIFLFFSSGGIIVPVEVWMNHLISPSGPYT
jgi:hypothetical protein